MENSLGIHDGWNPADWAQMVSAVNALEAAWKDNPFPDLASFLPVNDDTRERILIELIKVDQECRWRIGEGRLVEFYLQIYPELAGSTTAVVDLLCAECWTRATYDVAPSTLELKSRFPHAATQIDLVSILAETAAEGRDCQKCPPINGEQPGTETGIKGTTPEDHLLLAAGTDLGRFQIRGLLGRGSMGIVYRAYDPNLAREVALKIPRFEHETESAIKEQFLKEARSAARIRHPNICPIYEAGQIDGRYFVIMALLGGETLGNWLKQHTPSTDEASAIICKLAKALDKLHIANIVHRDIKPQNIVIDENSEPLLMDFGLAWQVGSVTSSTLEGFVGTPAYMSPEQVCGHSVDHRSDIYSLGVVLYQMLAGQLPFSGTLYDVLTGVVQREPRRLSEIRPDIDLTIAGICSKAMSKQPLERYQSAGEFARALEHREMPITRNRGRPRIRFPTLWLTCVISIIGCCAIVIVSGIPGQKSTEAPSTMETPSQARTLDLGPRRRVSIEATIKNTRDKLWFRVQAVDTGLLLLETVTPAHDFNGNMAVFDSELNEIVEDQNSGIGNDSQVVLTVKKGETYFARISSAQRRVGPFLVIASQPEAKPPAEPFLTEGEGIVMDSFGDDQNSAHELDLTNDGIAAVVGSIWPEHDEDWFNVNPAESGVMVITPETPLSSLDSLAEVYDRQSLISRDRDRVVCTMEAGKPYFVRITGTGGGPGGGILPTGNYVLRLRFLQNDLVTPVVLEGARQCLSRDIRSPHESKK